MQSPAPSGSGPASAIALSPIERPAFAHLFNLADPDRTGIVTGDAAVSFFAKSKLPPPTLGQIWALADSANNGFLTPPSFSTALRLIGHAQRGEPVTEALIKRPGPPPTLEGITLPISAQLTGTAAPSQPPHMPGVIEIKPEDRARYTRIFAGAGPQGGLIDGEKAKEIFVKSKLPFDKLGAIWNLADTQARGSLDLTDFVIGMHFIQNIMNGSLNSIPAVLPPGLYEQAKGGSAGSRLAGLSASPVAPQYTGGSASGAIARQVTGQPLSSSASRTFSPGPPSAAGTSAFQSPQPTGANASAAASAWDVTPEEKLRSDRFFDGLDSEKKGELDGAAVVPFFMQSKLTEAVLAHVWDLSDITQTGTLGKDEFAVAMHLINQQLAGKEIPQESLPQSLIPPSMRSMTLPQAVNPLQSDTQKDLFSLMDDDPPPPAVSATSAFIAPSSAAPTVFNNTGAGSGTAMAVAAAPRSTAPGPFDDDFFGGSSTPSRQPPSAAALSPALTGGSFGGATAGVRSPLQAPSTPSRAGSSGAAAFGIGGGGDQSAEYGNKSIQLQSTQKAVSDLQTKRSGLESAVTSNATSLAELETRLATVRSQHETESKLVRDLEARRSTQNDELKKLREEVIREESALSALKAEKDELEQAVMRDREDVRDMKKSMADVQVETKSLKETLEKLRKDARQQKGLVAISKKQLGAAESERDKVQADISAAERGERIDDAVSPVAGPRDLASPSAFAVASPIPATEAILSPAASVRSTNPFDRFGAGASRPDSPSVVAASTPGHAAGSSRAAPLAAGAGAGALLAGTAAAAASADTAKDSDPFSVARTSQGTPSVPTGDAISSPAPAARGFDDAFAVSANSGQPSGDFDDSFGDDFAASASTPVVAEVATDAGVPATTTAFEDAFGDEFNGELAAKPATTATGPAADTFASAAGPAEDSFGSSFAPVPAIRTPEGAAAEPEHAAQSDEEDHDRHREDEADSSDEEEGPEDVGGYRQATPGDRQATETPTVGTRASEKFPEIKPETEGGPFGGGQRTTEVEEVPSIPGGFGAFGEAADEMPAQQNSTVDVPEPVVASAPVDSLAIGKGDTASTASIAPVSRQDSGNAIVEEPRADANAGRGVDATETGFDNATVGSALGTGALAVAGVGAAPVAVTPGGLDPSAQTRMASDAPPLSPSAEDDDVPLGQILSKRAAAASSTTSPAAVSSATLDAHPPSLSPASSIKTRRAPPPAPVRQSTLGSVASANAAPAPAVPAPAGFGSAATVDDSNPFGTDDFAPAPVPSSSITQRGPISSSDGSATAPIASTASKNNNQHNNFDDFDSAFEDLGQADVVPAGAGTATSSAPVTGFDDAFDNDFDFVPSFAPSGSVAAGAQPASTAVTRDAFGSTATAAGAVPAPAINTGFEDFDSAFDPISGSATSASNAGAPLQSGLDQQRQPSQQQPQTSASNSGSGSGFSFEDAFAPSSSAAAPATTTNPTVYAPPPGPPPPELPGRRTTASTGGTSQAVNALPDDAGPVKQLCGMGFERPKVIEALERSNYRTEKALERLLAQA